MHVYLVKSKERLVPVILCCFFTKHLQRKTKMFNVRQNKMFEGLPPPLLSRQSSTLPLPVPTKAGRTFQNEIDLLMPPRKVRE